jgi:hypothetical protein
MKLFLDTKQAARFLNMSPRHFARLFIEAQPQKIRVLRFTASRDPYGRGDGKHMFLRSDLEKVKANGSR